MNFNSIKVRLKQKRPENDTTMPTEFQFHKGTIKTPLSYNAVKSSLSFQFHKGTIKTNSLHYDSEAKRNFNSIKVRLKPARSCTINNKLVFQFHKGTIKTKIMFLIVQSVIISIP